MELEEIWKRAFDIVRKEVPLPSVWLAMQAAKPLTIDGNYFVARLPRQEEYLSSHLLDFQAATAIENALREITGRILAFRVITGETVSDWEAQKTREAAAAAPSPPAAPPPATLKPAPTAATPPPSTPPAASEREISPSWEKLSERIMHGFKGAPFVKYPHGQAQYVLTVVKVISDTMDVLMPPPGAPRDDHQERMLARTIERFGSMINLDPMFLSLELFHYRESQGKNPDVPL
jgi:hypothetical protein